MRIEIPHNESDDGLTRELWTLMWEPHQGYRLVNVQHQIRVTKRSKFKVNAFLEWSYSHRTDVLHRLPKPTEIPLSVMMRATALVVDEARKAPVFIGFYNEESLYRERVK